MVNKKPKVTIGMPVYNGSNRVKMALNSLVQQDYEHIEIIISDNCSTDGTQSILKGFEDKYPNVRAVYQNENKGIFPNFKILPELATGEYFMWAAHDDVWHPSTISILAELLEKNLQSNIAMGSWETDPDPKRNQDAYKVIYNRTNRPESYSNERLALLMLDPVPEAFFMCIYGLGRIEYMRALSRNLGRVISNDRLFGIEVALSTTIQSTEKVLLKKYVSPHGQMTRFKGDPTFFVRDRSRLLYCIFTWWEYARCLFGSNAIPFLKKYFIPIILVKLAIKRTIPQFLMLFIPEVVDFLNKIKAFIKRRMTKS